MKLVKDAKQAWRWLSVQIPVINIALLGTWSTLPSEFRDVITTPWIIGIAVFLLVAGVFGRLVDQPKEKNPLDEPYR